MKLFHSYILAIILSTVLGIFCFSVVQAQTTTAINAGFVNGIWYSKTPFFNGDDVRIYSAVQNQSQFDIIGKINFFDNGELIGSVDFSATTGQLAQKWIDWKASGGNHALHATVSDVKKTLPGKEPEAVEIGNVSLPPVTQFVDTDTDKDEIGEAGTDSEALHEHKAFLFDKNKNLLVIPVTEVRGKMEYDSRLGYYRQRLWQGAYVFDLNVQDGFKVKGKITHNEADEADRYYWWGSPNVVRRSLYMDDVLYTVSMKKILMNSIEDIDDEINEIDLPYKEDSNYPYPMYY